MSRPGEEAQGPPSRRDGEDVKVPWMWVLVIYFSSDTFSLGKRKKSEIDTISFESRELIVAQQQSCLVICFQTCGCLLGFLSYFMAHFQRFL